MSDNFNHQRGNVLIYALLIIAAILSTTIVISNLVQSSIKQMRFIADAQAAFYAAESGMEKALYSIRKNDVLPENNDCGVGPECEIEINDKEVAELSLNLTMNDSVQFDLFNPNDNSKTAGIESISFEWDTPSAWLEMSIVGWQVGSAIELPKWASGTEIENLPVQKFLYSGGEAINNFVSANKNYRVRVKALYNEARRLRIKLFASDDLMGGQKPFLNFLKIKTIGTSAESTQTIRAEMPRYAPLGGLFDYVLFSEEIISK